MYSGHAPVCVCLSVSVRGRMSILHECNLGNGRDAPNCALFGGFAIGARVALLWQHSANAKCQRVLLLALALYLIFYCICIHCVSKTQGTTILFITSPNVDRFSIFFTDRFTSKYATNSSLTIPPHPRVSLNYFVKHPYRKIAKI